MAGTIDLDKTAKYPIVLSDELLGRGSKEIFTGIRYKQRPPVPSDPSLVSRELKPSSSGNKSKHNLSVRDGTDKYEYQGNRLSGDGQYILVFDAVKKHFVLHQVDSTLDMSMTVAPWETADSPAPATAAPAAKNRRKSTTAAQSKPKPKPAATAATDKRRKPEPKPKKAKPPPREPTPDAEDEDSDDGLTVEYPGGKPPPRYQSRPVSRASPIPQIQRREEPPSEESDADAEYEDDDEPADDRNRDVDVLMLPSPAAAHGEREDVEEEEEEDDLDLAAELEQALEKETGAKADESSESEEE